MGARIALQVAARDARVESLVLMEGIYIKSTRYYVSRILDPLKWKRLLTGRSHKIRLLRERGAALLRRAADKRRAAPTEDSKPKVLLLEETGEKSVNSVLRALLARAVKIMLLFRDGNEIAYNYHLQMDGDDIVAVGLPDGLRVEFVRFADHTFTPLISQELLLKTTMRWIERTHFSSRKPFKIAA
jgi:pimeloyl-ACP methyl ester carboxylesterase